MPNPGHIGSEGSDLPPPAKRRVWPWILLGCGIVPLLAILAVAGLGLWGFQALKGATRGPWQQLVTLERQLSDNETTRDLYQASPGIHATYPTEDVFIETVTAWRQHLEPLPAEPPSLLSGSYTVSVKVMNSVKDVSLGYRNPKGTWLRARWLDNLLAEVVVEPFTGEETPEPEPTPEPSPEAEAGSP
jgi:hypothetical protein